MLVHFPPPVSSFISQASPNLPNFIFLLYSLLVLLRAVILHVPRLLALDELDLVLL